MAIPNSPPVVLSTVLTSIHTWEGLQVSPERESTLRSLPSAALSPAFADAVQISLPTYVYLPIHERWCRVNALAKRCAGNLLE